MSGVSLGDDLETEILLHLPAKSLIRLRCVQKSWNILFNTPTFVRRRLQNKHENKNRSLVVIHESNPPYMTLLRSDNNYEDPILIKSFSLFPNDNAVTSISYYGNCNGVFCLEGFYNHTSIGQLILWNPTTREVHLIPPAPSSFHGRHADKFLHGFGADNKDGFKVVKLSVSSKREMKRSLEIYKLSTKSWTRVCHSAPPIKIPHIILSRYNALVNGIYHWITRYDHHGVAYILCFDFGNNQFHQLRGPAPCHDRNLIFIRDDLAEIKGSLAYVREYWPTNFRYYYGSYIPVQLGIWVMDQSGWAKKYDIGPIVSLNRMHVLWKDVTQLLSGKVGQPLMSYDHDGNLLHQFQFHLVDSKIFLVHEYVESIAPLSI